MKLLRMTKHFLQMEWYFFLWVKVSKWNNQKYGDKFYYHAEQIKNEAEKGEV